MNFPMITWCFLVAEGPQKLVVYASFVIRKSGFALVDQNFLKKSVVFLLFSSNEIHSLLFTVIRKCFLNFQLSYKKIV